MKILVCIKQVPGSNNVEVDPITGVLKRSGIRSKMNPYDLFALDGRSDQEALAAARAAAQADADEDAAEEESEESTEEESAEEEVSDEEVETEDEEYSEDEEW